MTCAADLHDFLRRHIRLFAGRSVLAAGDLPAAGILEVFRETSRCTLLTDHLSPYIQIAAALGHDTQLAPGCISCQCSSGPFTALFAAVNEADTALSGQDFELLLVVLGKSKPYSKQLLQVLSPHLSPSGRILLAGHNSMGGRSAAGLLVCAPHHLVCKLDSARKCTLYEAPYLGPFPVPQPCTITTEIAGQRLELLQAPGVFARGRADAGTLVLLETALPLLRELPRSAPILDLGCGCGIISICLAGLGFTNITASDASAQALTLACANIMHNKCAQAVTLQAADLLEQPGTYELIISNPPGHTGLRRSHSAIQSMLQDLDQHLSPQGRLLMVENTGLHDAQACRLPHWHTTVLSRLMGYVVLQTTRQHGI